MIELEHIVKDFGTGEKQVHAVRDVSLSVSQGEIFGIIGFSGAGKSTLVRCVNMLERPTAGKVTVDGQDMTAAVINGNYALDFGLKTEEAVYTDTVLDQVEYWNLIAARTADLEDPDLVAVYAKVVAAFQSEETEAVFNGDFNGYFIAVGWDDDLLADYQ